MGPFSYVRKMWESRPMMVQTEVTGLLRGQGRWVWGSRGKWAKAHLSLCPLPRLSTCSYTSASCGFSSSQSSLAPAEKGATYENLLFVNEAAIQAHQGKLSLGC